MTKRLWTSARFLYPCRSKRLTFWFHEIWINRSEPKVRRISRQRRPKRKIVSSLSNRKLRYELKRYRCWFPVASSTFPNTFEENYVTFLWKTRKFDVCLWFSSHQRRSKSVSNKSDCLQAFCSRGEPVVTLCQRSNLLKNRFVLLFKWNTTILPLQKSP